MYFPSRKDSWLTILIWLFAFLFIIPPVFSPDFGVWLTPEFLDKQWIKIVVLWSVGFCLLWILVQNRIYNKKRFSPNTIWPL